MVIMADPQAVADAMREHSLKPRVMEPISGDILVPANPTANDEIVDKIIGANKGRSTERMKQKCEKCNRMITKNNMARHMETHLPKKMQKPYPRTDCKFCGQSVGNNNLSRHEQNCPKRVADVDEVINAMVNLIGGITVDNLDAFIAWRDVTEKLAKA
jgi:hypothetical protein